MNAGLLGRVVLWACGGVAFGSLASGSVAWAQDAASLEMPSTAARGMAGAGTARVDDSTAAQRGAAALLLGIRYGAQADFGFGAGLTARGALADTRTSDLGAVATWTGFWGSPPVQAEDMPGWLDEDGTVPDNTSFNQSVRASVGYGFLRDQVSTAQGASEIRRLALAATVAWDREDAALTGVHNTFDLGASVAGRPVPALSVVLSARDLLPTGPRDPSAELGLAWAFPTGVLVGDLGYDPALGERPLLARAGAEVVLAEKVPLRAGWAMTGLTHTLGAGVGLAAPSTRIDYAVNLCVAGPCRGLGSWQFLTHSVGILAVF